MSRVSRMVVTDSGQKAAYDVISRTALDGLPFYAIQLAIWSDCPVVVSENALGWVDGSV